MIGVHEKTQKHRVKTQNGSALVLVMRGWLKLTGKFTGAERQVTDWSAKGDTVVKDDWMLAGVHMITRLGYILRDTRIRETGLVSQAQAIGPST